MAQPMTVKLTRFDGAPWGFRLQGGKDFAQPLCIQKVNGGSPAEQAGLQAGDALVKLNDIDLFSMRHKEAQDAIVRAGNSFEITIQRGGGVWKPAVQPIGNIPKPAPQQNNVAPAPVTKTSLVSNKPESAPIGTGHNNVARPFGAPQMNGGPQPVKSIVNKQYNTPVGIYSEENIAETLSAQAEVLAGGVLGVNFKKNERTYQPNNSEVLRMVQEVDLGPREQEPEGTRYTDAQSLEYKENLRNARNTADAQSHSFRRLQALLNSGQDPAFSPGAGLRRVTAPVTAPAAPQTQAAAAPSKTQLPPGQNICSECERLIVGVFVRIKEKNLHVECFKCATCGASLKNVGYYNIGTKLYCDVHAKMAARQQPPGPNMEPVIVPPGQRPPQNTVSAALAAATMKPAQGPAPAPAPAPAVSSPQANTNMAPLPFHAPRRGTSHVNAPRTFMQNQTPQVSAPVAQSAPKPFFAPPAPTVSSAAMNKPAGGFQSTLNKPVHARPGHPKFVWPPQRPEDIDPMITGPTATPIYINPMEPTPLERPPPQQQLVAPNAQGKPTIIAPVHAPRPITPVRKDPGPPVHPPMALRPPVVPDRPVSPMVFALTTAPEQPYNIQASPSLVSQGQKKGTSLAAQQQSQLPNFQPSFDMPPQPYHQQVQAPKPIHSVQPPKLPAPQPQFSQPAAPIPVQAPPAPAPVQAPPAPAPIRAPPAPLPVSSHVPAVRDIPVQVEQRPAPPPVTQTPMFPAAPQVRQIPVQVEQRPAPAPAARPLSPLPQLTQLAPKQTFPPPAPINFGARPTSPLPPLASIPAKQTFPPPAPLLSKALGSAMAAAPKAAPPQVTSSPPAPAPGAAPAGGNPKAGTAGTSAPRRGRGVLTAPVTGGGRVPLCGMCQGQIRGPFITAMGKTWCPDHFICVNSQCQRQLQDCGFVEEKGELYCEYCFEQFLAPPCDKCRKKIKGDCLNAIGKHFHPECFVCAYCSKLFGNNPFFLEDGLPYCENDWNELFTTKCFACGFPIEAGDRWVEALNNNYHSQCFNCTMCKKNLEGQSFFAKQGRPFCKTHAR